MAKKANLSPDLPKPMNRVYGTYWIWSWGKGYVVTFQYTFILSNANSKGGETPPPLTSVYSPELI